MTVDKEKQSIKYRLIGALVIIVSFSLAWLLLLDHDVKRQKQWSQNIPKPIVVEPFEVTEVDIQSMAVETVRLGDKQVSNPEGVADESNKVAADTSTLNSSATSQPKPQSEPKAKPEQKPRAVDESRTKNTKSVYTQLNDKGLPEAWVLQIASFKEKSNAKQLQQKLLKHGHHAYIKVFNLSSGRIYRVLVGPKMSKASANSVVKKIEKQLGLKAMLVQYRPGFEE